MTEPCEIADQVETVVAGVHHWHIHNSSIGGAISSSHAVEDGDGVVMVDPVHLADAALAALPQPGAVVLTARCHQRSAWRYRSQFGIEVWLPADAEPADEEPDRRYAEGDVLPGGLVAVRTAAGWTSCRRSSTRTLPRRDAASNAFWIFPSRSSAWPTARRSPTIRKPPCASCSSGPHSRRRQAEAGRLRLA